MSKSLGISPSIVPGSWGAVPLDLQTLPAGAQNCGTIEGQPTIVSPLTGTVVTDTGNEAYSLGLFPRSKRKK